MEAESPRPLCCTCVCVLGCHDDCGVDWGPDGVGGEQYGVDPPSSAGFCAPKKKRRGYPRAAHQSSDRAHHAAIPKEKYGMDKVSNLPLVKSFRVLCKYRTSPTSALDDAFCPVFCTVRALGLRRNFAQFEVLHDPQIVNDFLRLITEGIVRAKFLQMFD